MSPANPIQWNNETYRFCQNSNFVQLKSVFSLLSSWVIFYCRSCLHCRLPCSDSRAKMQMNLGNENILNDSEAESSAFQWQNRLPYFALEKISPHRTLWTCSWAAFGMQANLDRSTTRYTTKAHCYTDKLKHLALCKLLLNKKMPVTKSSWLLNQNWRLSPFFHCWPVLILSVKLHRKQVISTKLVCCMLFHLTKSIPCGPGFHCAF